LLSPTLLYVFGDLEDVPPPQRPKQPGSDIPFNRQYSFVNIDRSRNYYKHYFTGQNPATFRYVGYFLRFSTVLVTGYAAYYTKVQADMATIQALHTASLADVAAVEAGLISKEIYYQKHPSDAPPPLPPGPLPYSPTKPKS